MITGTALNGRQVVATRQLLLLRDGNTCGICGRPLGNQVPDIDHVVPRSQGGSNALTNLRLTHASENRAHGADLVNHKPRPLNLTAPPPNNEWNWLK